MKIHDSYKDFKEKEHVTIDNEDYVFLEKGGHRIFIKATDADKPFERKTIMEKQDRKPKDRPIKKVTILNNED